MARFIWSRSEVIVRTNFENEDLSGKKLLPFSTHEGSGLANFDSALAEACPDSEVLEGLAVRGQDAQNDQDNVKADVKDWLYYTCLTDDKLYAILSLPTGCR